MKPIRRLTSLLPAIAPIIGGIGRKGPKDVTPDFDQWAKSLAAIFSHKCDWRDSGTDFLTDVR
jgi:hypothetical protein